MMLLVATDLCWVTCISFTMLVLFHVKEVRLSYLTVAGLAQSVERLTAQQEVAGSIPGVGPLLRVLK